MNVSIVAYRFISISLVLALYMGLIGTPSQAASCKNIESRAIDPDYYHGVRTKWKSLTRDSRNSILPDFFGLKVDVWVTKLETVGVNLAELNIDPRRRLSTSPSVDATTWRQYINYALSARDPPAQLDYIEKAIIPKFKYTIEQRDLAVISFLQQLEDLKQAGKLSGDIKFIIHQRMWFNGDGRRGEKRRKRATEEFSLDMAELINQAREQCLDHWIAGIRLGEHAVKDMNILMPVVDNLANRINSLTDDWLREKLFLVNGGGWGAEYDSFDYDFDSFFKAMSQKTAAFAIGYKFMQFNGKNQLGYIRQRMPKSICNEKPCDQKSKEDWELYLNRLGLNKLKAIVHKYHNSYPMHANVMFVGDSSDSLQTIFQNGRSPELDALREILPNEQGWTGKLFMSGFIDDATLNSRIVRNQGTDVGWGLYYISGGQAILQKKTYELWKNW